MKTKFSGFAACETFLYAPPSQSASCFSEPASNRFSSSFTNEATIATYGLQKILGDGTILNALLVIMNKVGSAVFDNLPLIFAVGVAIGMAKKRRGSSSFRTDRLLRYEHGRKRYAGSK